MRQSWILRAFLGALCLLPMTAHAEIVTCKARDDANVAFQLNIDWQSETATILRRQGNTFAKVFEKATVVRNSAADAALLAEGTAGNYVGNFNNSCGGIIEQLYFDLAASNGHRAGTVTSTLVWAIKPGVPRKSCRPKFRIPEVTTDTIDVVCE